MRIIYFARALDDLNLRILYIFEGTFLLDTTHIKQLTLSPWLSSELKKS